VALSFAMVLDPADLAEELTRRLAGVEARLAHLDSQLRDYRESVPRIALIETEYASTVARAEADWLSGVIADIQSGKLAWSRDQIAAQAAEAFFDAADG
jgi:hypothetical protein